MYILDTDHLTLVERGGSAAFSLQIRLSQVPVSKVGTTIVNYEEQMRGWLSHAASAKTLKQIQEGYALLEEHIETFNDFTILLSFDAKAAEQFDILRKAQIRVGAMDLKIAAICLANNATLLSRNLRDFGQVPGLMVEDWSA
jgi:tRNA(fMet)-specific endonuclease VapC